MVLPSFVSGPDESVIDGAPAPDEVAPAVEVASTGDAQQADADGAGVEAAEPGAAASPPPEAPTLSEAEQILGPDVRSPVGIPSAYHPTEASTHALLRVELTDFVGPMDLLLFLIRKHDVDVFDIPISFLAEQYMAMLDRMEELDIDVAGEFLVMAAELTHIKSKMLLPAKEGVPLEEDEDEGDPRSDLVRRLLEYQKYRDAAEQLGDRDRLGRDTWARDPGDPQRDESFDAGFRNVNMFKLVEAMSDVLARLEPEAQHEVTADRVTVTDRVHHILGFAKKYGKRFTFVDLFMDGEVTRRSVVMTFLATLEMARTQVLRITQQPEPIEAPPPPLDDDADDATQVAEATAPVPQSPAAATAPASEAEAAADSAPAPDEAPTADDDAAEAELPPEIVLVAPEVDVEPLTPPAPGDIVLELTDTPPPADLLGGRADGAAPQPGLDLSGDAP